MLNARTHVHAPAHSFIVPMEKDTGERAVTGRRNPSTSSGYKSLLLFSLFVSTFYPATSLLYRTFPQLSPSTFNALRNSIAALSVLLFSLFIGSYRPRHHLVAALPRGDGCLPATGNAVWTWWNSLVQSVEVRSGLELGLYNYMGSMCQAEGLKLASPTKAAFIGQLTTVLVPLLSWLVGDHLAPATILACLLAFFGTVLVQLDKAGAAMPAAHKAASAMNHVHAGTPAEARGEMLIMASALFHATMIVRLGKTAYQCAPVSLARAKLAATAALALLYWAAYRALHSAEAVALPTTSTAWLAILYLGVVPGGVSTILQVYGQSSVPPAMAQVIYSTMPLWCAAMAQLLGMQDAAMGLVGWLGGMLILVAGGITVLQAKPHQ